MPGDCRELSVMKRFLRKISVDKLSVLWYKVQVLIFYQLLDHDLASRFQMRFGLMVLVITVPLIP